MKRFFILIFILILLILTRCLIFTNSNNNRADEACKKLSQRYNKDFTIKEVYPKKIGQKYYEVAAYPEDDPDVLFIASIDTNDDFFSDSYVERHICKQISKEIYTNLGLEDNIYIFTEALGTQPITYDLEQSIQEYVNLNQYNKFKASIFVTYETDDLYNSDILFSNLKYLDISAKIYIVNKEQLQEVKTFFSNHIHTNNLDYKTLVKDFTSRTV